jgi:hypothetical protein
MALGKRVGPRAGGPPEEGPVVSRPRRRRARSRPRRRTGWDTRLSRASRPFDGEQRDAGRDDSQRPPDVALRGGGVGGDEQRQRPGPAGGRPGYSTLPGFITPVGSSVRLIARITSVASPSSLTR